MEGRGAAGRNLSLLLNPICWFLGSSGLRHGAFGAAAATYSLSPLPFQRRGGTHGHFHRHRCHAGHDARREEGGRLRLRQPNPGAALPDGTDRCKRAAPRPWGCSPLGFPSCSRPHSPLQQLRVQLGVVPGFGRSAETEPCRGSLLLGPAGCNHQLSLAALGQIPAGIANKASEPSRGARRGPPGS